MKEEGGVTSNNWVVEEIESGSTQRQMKKLNIISILSREEERMKVREVIPHIGPIPIVIPLKLFLEGIDFLADNVTSRVTSLSPFLILQRLHVITIIHFHKKNCFSRYFQRISKKYM